MGTVNDAILGACVVAVSALHQDKPHYPQGEKIEEMFRLYDAIMVKRSERTHPVKRVP